MSDPHMPTIRTARHLVKALGLQGVVVVGIADGKISYASYGGTMIQCRALAPLVDRIAEMVESGSINLDPFHAP